MVDAFVAQSKDTSRSYVSSWHCAFGDRSRDLFDEKYYSENADRLNLRTKDSSND
jgi:hypothetical protein